MRRNEPVSRKGVRADDHLLRGSSGKHKLRYHRHTELGVSGSDEYRHYPRDIHVHSVERFQEHDPGSNHHLHAHSNQCQWIDHVHSDRHRKHGCQTNHQFLYSQPHKHHYRVRQHTELGGNRSDEYCHYAGDIHVYCSKRVHERQPNGDHHLHADGDQYRWFDNFHRNRHRKHGS